jgi:hypothetical protein
MKFISTKVHGFFDYGTAVALFAAPFLFGFADLGGASVWVPWIIGAMILVQSLMTRYELGVVKVVPMSMHLMLDYGAALLLAISPWIFGFVDESVNVWLPHLVVGAGYFLISLMTETEPSRESAMAM